ncbi:hypothetical protein [Priestia koreensis]|uniref:Uncharacterized protein n=1 Tax=Priestia koreensis TaxID=284581 RepID=A0A0M0L5P9_9BACI|nr:hypothetical protein [Priestia koreensis]KOO46197.1 hypothetical protein AMD01_10050 [Priestia koreensis]
MYKAIRIFMLLCAAYVSYVFHPQRVLQNEFTIFTVFVYLPAVAVGAGTLLHLLLDFVRHRLICYSLSVIACIFYVTIMFQTLHGIFSLFSTICFTLGTTGLATVHVQVLHHLRKRYWMNNNISM